MDSLSPKYLLKIFENFTTGNYDHKTLHNCIFVNKQWSSLAISILWRNPLEIINNGYNGYNNKISIILIIKTYITCLPKESKDSFIKNGFQLSEEILRQASHDYPSHLQIINYQNFHLAIPFWIKENYHQKESNERIFCYYQLFDHIFKMLMNKCRKIYRIDLYDLQGSTKIIHFPLLPDSEKCLSNITEFYYKGKKHSDLMYILSQKCTQIKSFQLEDLDGSSTNNGLVQLFERQKVPLESLSVNTKNRIPLSIEDIIKKKENIDSIDKLKLSGCSRIFMVNCKNLKELDIDLNSDVRMGDSSWFPKLEKLRVTISYNNLNIVSDILKDHQNKIKYLHFRKNTHRIYNPQRYKEFSKFSENLIEYCPNLVVYEGPFFGFKIRKNLLLKFFRTCSNLEKLRFINFISDKTYKFDDILKSLSDDIPKKLNTLCLDSYWEFNAETLDVFLSGCKKRLTNKLKLEIPLERKSHGINLVLDKYVRKNVLFKEHIIVSTEKDV
ncbi:hypothetical protein C1645_774739 [Glomus cerebriforme]|uniref:F-box domain-containing protein n=1 Tax=Glomus cerebriforme TaxID=658196 RepID=A0A397SZZ4_9GLOM|nr:hypothetical protein C1645_774739 [Glomus cerebriforme]